MAFYAYMLRCRDGSYYTGHSEDLDVRLAQHQQGTIPGYTRDRRPVALVWCHDFPTRDEAFATERRIKGWSRAKKEALIAGDWNRISMLARNRQASRTSDAGGTLRQAQGERGESVADQTRLVLDRGLVAHPAAPSCKVDTVEVSVDLRRGKSVLTYRVVGDMRMAPASAPERTNDLWKHTCFELFVWPADGSSYFEFNFAPSTAWAAYRLESYRAGMSDLTIEAPLVERLADGVRVTIDLGGLPADDWRVGLSAVIEETDGTTSYWALAHPPGKPDFHDPACFALQLPAPQFP